MRVVGLDLGTKRVGVAVSDSEGTVATPHDVYERRGDERADRQALAALVRELDAERVVVGLPLSLDASVGPAASWASQEAAALQQLLDVPVELHDERLTTVAATRAPGPRRRRRRPQRVDASAAALVLQSWLDAQRRLGPAAGGRAGRAAGQGAGRAAGQGAGRAAGQGAPPEPPPGRRP